MKYQSKTARQMQVEEDRIKIKKGDIGLWNNGSRVPTFSFETCDLSPISTILPNTQPPSSISHASIILQSHHNRYPPNLSILPSHRHSSRISRNHSPHRHSRHLRPKLPTMRRKLPTIIRIPLSKLPISYFSYSKIVPPLSTFAHQTRITSPACAVSRTEPTPLPARCWRVMMRSFMVSLHTFPARYRIKRKRNWL